MRMNGESNRRECRPGRGCRVRLYEVRNGKNLSRRKGPDGKAGAENLVARRASPGETASWASAEAGGGR